MGLRRWEPFADLARLREDMDRWFGEFFPARRGEERPGLRLPAVDVVETDEAVIVKAELPGVDKKDLSVETLPDSVIIKAEAKARLKDGLLEVTLPKTEAAKVKQPTKVSVEGDQ